MNLQAFKNKNGLILLICVIAIILIYSIDVFKLAYRMTSWAPFGELPVAATHVEYFIADLPDVIGYKEPGGDMVSCATTVAYITTDTGDSFRCCDTDKTISCLAGDYSSDIPIPDRECANRLQEALAIPVTLEGARDYQIFGSCGRGEGLGLTTVQINATGQILWKYLNVGNITLLNSTLRCIVAPILILLIILIVVMTIRGIPKEPIPRF